MTSYGFLGLGIMGEGMANRLVQAGLDVTVWNRSPGKCAGLVAAGAKQGETAAAVVASCDITFACVSDPAAALALATCENGVVDGIAAAAAGGRAAGYVDMSTVDAETSQRIAALVTEKGGRFAEAPVSGSKKPAADGQLVILAAGDEALAAEAKPAFEQMGKATHFLGEVGNGARCKLIINMIMGIHMNALSEGLALGQSAGLDPSVVLQVLGQAACSSPMYGLKGPKVLAGDYAPNFPLKHMQKDMRLAVALGDATQQPLPTAAAANESFKRAVAAGRGDDDFSAVFATTTTSTTTSTAAPGSS